jgi:hypothetical protein
MTKQSATDSMGYDDNPGGRPKKYASAAERQAAYRARAVEVSFRADPGTVETLGRIAETIDVPRTDLLLSMTKFALANHDWARFGLTHKTLPKYQGNPIMATAAQIAARKRFAEMARSGAFAKTRKPAAKKAATRANPAPKKRAPKRDFYYIVKVGSHYDGQFSSAHYSLAQVQAIAQAKADKYGVQARITEIH